MSKEFKLSFVNCDAKNDADLFQAGPALRAQSYGTLGLEGVDPKDFSLHCCQEFSLSSSAMISKKSSCTQNLNGDTTWPKGA